MGSVCCGGGSGGGSGNGGGIVVMQDQGTLGRVHYMGVAVGIRAVAGHMADASAV